MRGHADGSGNDTSRRVLYVTYTGLAEALGRRQVLPYLQSLAGLGWRHTILSFERPGYRESGGAETVQRELPPGSRWIPLRYHKRPSALATALDVALGVAAGLGTTRNSSLLHARSTVPGLVTAILSKLTGRPWIFDVRGLVAEEYADARHWSRTSLLFRLTDRVERGLLRRAGGLVFLTHAIAEELRARGAISATVPVAVIPCAVDLDVFAPSAEARSRVRREAGLEDGPVLVYAGSLGSWYCADEMMAFFMAARGPIPGLQFLVLTPQVDRAVEAATRLGVGAHVRASSVRPDEVPAYLAAADAGICFLHASHSKKASCPTKYGEYLASGLPIVTDAWTGDASRHAAEAAWVQVDAFDAVAYRNAAERLRGLLETPELARREARALAAREFALHTAAESYHQLYRQVLERG